MAGLAATARGLAAGAGFAGAAAGVCAIKPAPVINIIARLTLSINLFLTIYLPK
jgi:hypothetical protein